MDSLLFDVLCDSIEGPIISLILLGNIFSISVYYLGSGIISVLFIVFMFFYSKEAIIQLRNLDLQLRNPVY